LGLSLNTYLALFAEAKTDTHKAIGEGSTSYLFSRVAVPKVLEYNSEAKFIVMLRNPVDLVQSLHAEQLYWGFEDVRDFETAWKLEPARRRGHSIPPRCFEPVQLFYSEWGHLGDQMERLLGIVPRERVKVILYDDFVKDTKGVYEGVLSFLEVPSDHRSDFPMVNANKAVRFLLIQQRLSLLSNCYRRIRNRFGLRLGLGFGLIPSLMRLNSKTAPRKPISPAFRAELNEFFREDVAKLSRILGRDLSDWLSPRQIPQVKRG